MRSITFKLNYKNAVAVSNGSLLFLLTPRESLF
nr:MAG TPA: hypothetical protein [Caudoviricetes sp.]